MKRLIVLNIFIIVACSDVFAQELSYGIKAGMNVSKFLSDDSSDDFEAKIRIIIGAFLEIPISEKFSIQPELIYSGQGATETTMITNTGVDDQGQDVTTIETRNNKYLYDYLNIPVLAKYYVNDVLSIHAGPQLGILLSANGKIETDNDEEVEIDISSGTEPIDFSFSFGIGYEFGDHFLIDARYNMGLTNVVDSNDGTLKNGVFQFAFGYKF